MSNPFKTANKIYTPSFIMNLDNYQTSSPQPHIKVTHNISNDRLVDPSFGSERQLPRVHGRLNPSFKPKIKD